MKQKIAPTSPKNRQKADKDIEKVYRETLQQNFDRPQKKSFGLGNAIFFLVVSLVGGVIGAVFFLSQNERFGFFSYSTPVNSVLIRNGSKAYTEQEEFMESIVKKVAPSVLRLYDQEIPEKSSTIQDALLTQEHFVGYGFLLTSDGLSFTSSEVLREGTTYTALDNENVAQSVKVTYRDPTSGISFFSFPGSEYQVIDIADADNTFPLENVLVMQKPDTQKQYSISEETVSNHVRDQLLYPDLYIMSSEKFFSEVQLDSHLEFPKGTPVLRGDGTLLGFFNGTKDQPSVVYLPERRPVINQYLVDKKIDYPKLSVNGIDLSLVSYVPQALRQNLTRGFLLASSLDGMVPAVTPDSPADVAGLQEGDVITQVNNQTISDTESIGQALLTVGGQEQIPVTFIRDGKEQTVSVGNTKQTP